MNRKLTAVGLFTGCGGSSLGVKLAGFHELLAIDFDKNSVLCHEKNFPETKCIKLKIDQSPTDGSPKTSDEINRILREIGHYSDLDLMQLSPPCQYFSMSNIHGHNLEHIKPFFDSLDIIPKVRPKVFIIENVEGALKSSRAEVWFKIRAALHQTGYSYSFKVLNAKNYGVPQSRKRLIIVGVRPDLADLGFKPVFPKPIDIDPRLLSMKHVLPSKPNYFSTSQFLDSLISADEICHTITKNPNLKLYDSINSKHRKPTVVELKILSSFPEDFQFPGSYSDAVSRMGNCVPPLLMRAVAPAVRVGMLDPYYAAILKAA